MDLTRLEVAKLDQLIENIRRKGAVAHPRYRAALLARESRAPRILDVETSWTCVREATIGRRCTSYSALAEASGVGWSSACWAIGAHM